MESLASTTTLDNALCAAALSYAARGWAVFPLHSPSANGGCSCGNVACPSPGKHPRTEHGFHDATTDVGIIEDWWNRWPDANIGIATGQGSGFVVVDVDGPAGAASIEQQGGLPLTVQVQTGKGTHYYFRYPGNHVPSRVGILRRVDIRADGGYVVAPPSLHASGQAYAWIQGPDAVELADLPDWVTRSLNAPTPLRCESVPGAPIPEGTRNDTLYRMGRSLHFRGAAPETIRRALRSDNRLRCQPPLSDSEVEAIAAHASAQGDRDDFQHEGNADEEDEDSDVDAAKDDDGRLSEPVSTLLVGEIPPITWLVEDLLAAGNNGAIGAEPKVGKSWGGLELGRCVATGADFLGYHVPEARRVLYIQEEDGWRRVSSRLRRLIKGAGAANPSDENLRVIIRKGFRIDVPGPRAALDRELEAFSPALVIVDVFNSIHAKDEQSQKEISEVLRHFTALNRKYGCAFILLHHFRKTNSKGGSSRGGQNLRGSSAFHGWVENSLYLTWTAPKSFNVEVESKDFDCDPFAVTITDVDGGGVKLEAHPLGLASRGAWEKDWPAVEALFATQKTITALDAAGATRLNKTTAAARLKSWTEQGRLEEEHLKTGGRHGTFVYRLAETDDVPGKKNSKRKTGA